MANLVKSNTGNLPFFAAGRRFIPLRAVRNLIICPVALILFLLQPSMAFAQGTAFTYQGRLNDGANPANGTYDLTFQLFDSGTNGTLISGPVTNAATRVTNGLFATTIDFGGVFNGPTDWLQIGVRTNGSVIAFTALSPRQAVLPVPYAIFANSASNLVGNLPASQLSGTLPATAFAGYTNTVILTNSANQFGGSFNGNFTGSFSGNGGGLANIGVGSLVGVLTPSQLPANAAFVNSNQTFTASNSFTGPIISGGTNLFTGVSTFTNNLGNSFSGSFFGNGLVGWLVVPGTAVQSQIDTGYVLTNSQLVTVTLPTNAAIRDIVRISGAGAGGWQVAQNAGQSIIGNFSSFGKSSWASTSALNPENWDSVAVSADGSKIFASVFGSVGGLFLSTDSGVTWKATNSTAGSWRSVCCSADGSKLFAALYGGGVYTNSSGLWGLGGFTSGLNWISIACSSDGTKLVGVVQSGGLYTSTNSGATWLQQTSGLPSNPGGYFVTSSADGTKLIAAINGGGIYTSSNSGLSWGLSGAPGLSWISMACSADGTKLGAVTVGSGIYTSGNSGQTWTPQTNGLPASVSWSSITSSADGQNLAATVLGGGIYASSTSGSTWRLVNAPTNSNWYVIASLPNGDGLYACIYGGGIYKSIAPTIQTTSTTVGPVGYISGGQGTAVELQYIGNNQFMPVSSFGTIWAF